MRGVACGICAFGRRVPAMPYNVIGGVDRAIPRVDVYAPAHSPRRPRIDAIVGGVWHPDQKEAVMLAVSCQPNGGVDGRVRGLWLLRKPTVLGACARCKGGAE